MKSLRTSLALLLAPWLKPKSWGEFTQTAGGLEYSIGDAHIFTAVPAGSKCKCGKR